MSISGDRPPDWLKISDFEEISPTLSGVELPLFPLNMVLFPEMPLPLQIFEARYHQMIERCLSGNRLFGVALISEGAEVAGTAEVWPVGTVAHIEEMDRLPDGRLAIMTRGIQRFMILQRLPDDPYPRAVISIMPDEEEVSIEKGLVQEAQDLLLEYLKGMARRQDQDWGNLDMPDDPALLGYIVGAILPCSLPEKQQILQVSSAAERLQKEIPMLRKALEGLTSRTIRLFEPELHVSPN